MAQRLLRSIDFCLACKPHLHPAHLPPGTNNDDIKSTLYSTRRLTTLPELLAAAIACVILSLQYAGCSNSTPLPLHHINTLQLIASESLSILLETPQYSLVLLHPTEVFKPLNFPDTVNSLNELLLTINGLSKEILLDVHSVIEQKNYKLITARNSPIESLSLAALWMCSITALAHTSLLCFLRNIEPMPGSLEILLFGALLLPATAEEDIKGVSYQRNHRCLVYAQQLCASVCSLVLDSRLLQTLWMTREKLLKRSQSPGTRRLALFTASAPLISSCRSGIC